MPEIADSGLPYEATFVENITRARKAAGMSQTELARRIASFGLPFHQPTVQRMESGERPIRLNEAMVLCDIFELDFPEALHPETAERATQQMVNFLRSAHRDWDDTINNDLLGLSSQVAQARETLEMERSFYVRAMQSIGSEWDPELTESADQLIDAIWQVEKALRQTLRQAGVETYGGRVEPTDVIVRRDSGGVLVGPIRDLLPHHPDDGPASTGAPKSTERYAPVRYVPVDLAELVSDSAEHWERVSPSGERPEEV